MGFLPQPSSRFGSIQRPWTSPTSLRERDNDRFGSLGDLRNAYSCSELGSDDDQGRRENLLRKHLYVRSWEMLTLSTYLKMGGRLDFQSLFEMLSARWALRCLLSSSQQCGSPSALLHASEFHDLHQIPRGSLHHQLLKDYSRDLSGLLNKDYQQFLYQEHFVNWMTSIFWDDLRWC